MGIFFVAFGNEGGSIGVVEEFAAWEFSCGSVQKWGLTPRKETR